jgi:hypothetical protein
MTEYLSTKDVAEMLNTTPARITEYSREGRLIGAEKQGGERSKWIIPADAVLIPSETITQKILNYVDGLSDEEKSELSNEIEGNKAVLKYIGDLLERGYISELKRLDVNKEKLSNKKPKEKKTSVEVWTLIIESVKALAPAAVAAINVVAAVKGAL